jgi:hypothetical protein
MSLYLFESTLSIFAVSADEAGAEIPVYETETWTLIGQVAKAQLAPDVVATEKERGFASWMPMNLESVSGLLLQRRTRRARRHRRSASLHGGHIVSAR